MKINLWTDGSCIKNPGKGGWAWIAQYHHGGKDHEKSSSGSFPGITTNVKMELTALLMFLTRLKNIDSPIYVNLHHDYIGISEWLEGRWKRNEPSIISLLEEIEDEIKKKNVIMTFTKVKGHSTNSMNNRVDILAQNAARGG